VVFSLLLLMLRLCAERLQQRLVIGQRVVVGRRYRQLAAAAAQLVCCSTPSSCYLGRIAIHGTRCGLSLQMWRDVVVPHVVLHIAVVLLLGDYSVLLTSSGRHHSTTFPHRPISNLPIAVSRSASG